MVTIRKQIYQALISGLQFVLDPSTDWEWNDGSFVTSPNAAPKDASDTIAIKIERYNDPLTATPDMTWASPKDDGSDGGFTVRTVESTVLLEANGPKAQTWLDTFLMALAEPETIDHFRDLGFAVVDNGEGAIDVSAIVGARDQIRSEARVLVGCRAIRERVILGVDTMQIGVTLSDEEHADISTTIDADVAVE